MIADNRIAVNADWDDAMLKAEIAALHEDAFDLDLLGFAEEELGRLLYPDSLTIRKFPEISLVTRRF